MARRSPPVQTFDLNANVAANYARPPMDDGDMARAAGRAVASLGGALAKLAKASEDKASAASVEQAQEQAGRDAQASVAMPKPIPASDYLARLRQIESGGNDRAVNPNSRASGRYQFIPSTARQYGITDPFDVNQQEAAVRRFTEDNRRALAKALGRDPTPGELYLAHQQGASGATRLLANPDADAASIVGSAAIAQNGGRPGMTAGQFARMWMTKFETGTRMASPEIKPLQLRKDGTPQGDAYDEALLKAGGYRAKAAMAAGLDQIEEQFADDPEGFEREAEKLRDAYYNAFEKEPELQATAEADFELNAGPVRRRIYDARDRRAEGEMKQAAVEAVTAQGSLLEKQAYALGVNEDADHQLAVIQQRAMNVIDSALDVGALSPAEASRQRQAIVGRLVQARFDGVFDALKTPAEKQAFADRLASPEMQAELLEKLDLDDYRSLTQRYAMMARQETEKQDAGTRLERERFSKLVNDDVASLAATGKGVAIGNLPLSADEVSRVLGPERAQAWSEARTSALTLFSTTDGMQRLTAEQIEARLAGIEPKAGAEGYAGAEKTFSQAARVAGEVMRKRQEDPAAAVDEAFPELQDEALRNDPAKLAAARMERQAALGLPELARQPLTNAEARRMAERLTLYREDPEALVVATERLVAEMQQAYGEFGDDAMAQILRVNGVTREASAIAVEMMKKIGMGQPVTPADARAMDQATARDVADRAMSGEPQRTPQPPDRRRPASQPLKKPTGPNAAAVEHLRKNPHLAAEFDSYYGAGLAEKYLAAPPGAASRTLPDGSRELVHENGWIEIYRPDGSVEGRMGP